MGVFITENKFLWDKNLNYLTNQDDLQLIITIAIGVLCLTNIAMGLFGLLMIKNNQRCIVCSVRYLV